MTDVLAPADALFEESLADTPTWRGALAARPPAEQRALLARVEALPPDDPTRGPRLRRVALAVAPILDPADAADAARLRRILDAGAGFDPALEPVLRRAADGTCDPALLASARTIVGQWCVARAEFAEAERWYRLVLADTRGSGTRTEGIVTVNFARLCLGTRRDIEALALARRATRIFDAVAEPDGAVFAELVECHVLSNLEDWDRLEARLASVEARLERVAPARRGRIETSAQGCRAKLLVARGRPADALAATERLAQAVGTDTTLTPRAIALARAAALGAAGRLDEAAETAQAALEDGPDDDETALELLASRLEVALERREPDAEARARALLERLEGPAGEAIGPGRRFASVCRVAHALRASGAAADVLRRVYELKAADVLARLAELDRFARDFGRAATLDAEDRAVFEDYRARTGERRSRLLEAVASFLEEEARAGRARLPLLTADDGLVHTCAWCGAVRTRAGAWVPMPELLPHLPQTGLVRVSHGVCDACAPGLEREVEAVRRTAAASG